MAAEQFIRPGIIFVFIRVHSWLKTFRPSATAATIAENPVKKASKEGKVVIGATVTAANPDVAASLGYAPPGLSERAGFAPALRDASIKMSGK
jgi:hypothetical protein